MTNLAFHVVITAAPGRATDVEAFLHWAKAKIDDEPGTKTWYALRTDEGVYEIFDTFDDEAGRQAHWFGQVGDALRAKAQEGVLFAGEPRISKLTILASKEG